MPLTARNARVVLAAAAVLILALALRLRGAEAQSLWYDEGTSAALALRSFAQIGRDAARDIHPPLYYWMLAGWVRALGDSVLALRGLSVLLGVLGVAGVIGLGTALWGRTAGLASGLVAATSPYLIWYSQEVRSYILVAALVPPLLCLALGSPERPRGPVWWLGVAALTAAALYTHYLCGGVAVVAANVGFLVSALHHRGTTALRKAIPRWIGAQALALAMFAPWVIYALPALTSWPATSVALSIPFLARESALHLAIGSGPRLAGGAAVITLWAVTGALAFRLGRLGRFTNTVPAAVAVAAPAALLLLSQTRPAWDAKFLAPSAPGFELLVGAGLVAPALAARLRAGSVVAGITFALAAATVVVPRLAVLRTVAADPAYQRDDYRGIAQFVQRSASADDAVILNAPTQIEVFGYYHRAEPAGSVGGGGAAPADPAAPGRTLPASRRPVPVYGLPEARPPDPAATAARLAELAATHGDLYGVLWATSESDPDGLVEGWLNTHRPKAFDRWYGNIRLALWGRVATQPRDTRLTAEFANILRLDRLTLGADAIARGEVIEMTATWTPLEPVVSDLIIFAQLLDASGALAAGRDLAPIGGSAKTSMWNAASGKQIDRIGLAVPVDLAPGPYQLVLGAYDSATGTRLPISAASGVSASGDALTVGPIVVTGGS